MAMLLVVVSMGFRSGAQADNQSEAIYESAKIQRVKHFVPTYSVLLRDTVNLKNPGTVTPRQKNTTGKLPMVQLRNTLPVNIDVFVDGVYMGFVGKQAVVTLVLWNCAEMECRAVSGGKFLSWGPRKCKSAGKVQWYLQGAEM